jgi:FkbM family methyltransferase
LPNSGLEPFPPNLKSAVRDGLEFETPGGRPGSGGSGAFRPPEGRTMPDAVPPVPAGTAWSSRNALRGGVLAALSSAAAPPVHEEAPPVAEPVEPEPPPRGFGAALRAAGRRGLRHARPLAMPFLHRFQMRLGTAIDASDLATRVAGIESALAAYAERAEDSAARRFDAVLEKLDAAQERADATFQRVVAVRARLDAAEGRIGAAHRQAEAAQARLDEASLRLDALQGAVAALTGIAQAGAARRAPIPLGAEVMAWTPDGYLLLPAEDPRLVAAMSEGGVLEPGTRRVLSALLGPGGAFLDVGAHVGTMALPAARRVGEGGRVFAVEALPRLAALLRRNMALNDMDGRVSVAACAAADEDGEALLHPGEVLGHTSLLPQPEGAGREAVRVPLRRVDGVVPAGTRIAVAKIDAEGAELRVWRGMRRVLADSPGLAAVLEFGPSHLARAGIAPADWLGELTADGFEAYAIDEATGACRPADASALAAVFSVNILLLRPGAAARHPELVSA